MCAPAAQQDAGPFAPARVGASLARHSDRNIDIRTARIWQAYDQHLNMILGEVEETITTVEIDDETYEEISKVTCLHC